MSTLVGVSARSSSSRKQVAGRWALALDLALRVLRKHKIKINCENSYEYVPGYRKVRALLF